MTTDNITTYLGWVIAIGTLLFSWYKLRLETPGARADLAEKYHKMALASATSEQNMKVRIDEMEARLDGVETQLKDAEEYIVAMDEWAGEVLDVLRTLKVTFNRPKPERKRNERKITG
jgi:uncharacterized protein HemX